MLSRRFQTPSVPFPQILGWIVMSAGTVVGLSIGCTQTVWEHPVKGTKSLQQDMAECEERAGHAAQEGDPHTGNVLSKQDYITECLEAYGYSKRSGGVRN